MRREVNSEHSKERCRHYLLLRVLLGTYSSFSYSRGVFRHWVSTSLSLGIEGRCLRWPWIPSPWSTPTFSQLLSHSDLVLLWGVVTEVLNKLICSETYYLGHPTLSQQLLLTLNLDIKDEEIRLQMWRKFQKMRWQSYILKDAVILQELRETPDDSFQTTHNWISGASATSSSRKKNPSV